ncbi:Carboxylesterase NlhH [Thalassocella blandensis]|nr:Carboxylesterase NlhH [Thalassocella blandensis]
MDVFWANTILIIASVALCCSSLGRFRTPYNSHLSFPLFMISWLTSELAWLHFLLQGAACIFLLISHSFQFWQVQVAFALLVASMFLLLSMHRISLQTGRIFKQHFTALFGDDYPQRVAAHRQHYIAHRHHPRYWLRPFSMRAPNVVRHRDLAYGDDTRQTLDIYHSHTNQEGKLPVMLYIHGGGWIVGNKSQQALPMIYHLASKGWVVVTINYRLGPKSRFPDPLIDAKRALAWVKNNIEGYGGDANFVVTSGGSAGGQLALMLAQSCDSKWQPGFEKEDTQVAACVPLYAVYDFTNQHRFRTDNTFEKFLTRFVMPSSLTEGSTLWHSLSPIHQLHARIPPMLTIHGSHDSLVPIEEAREFANCVKKVSHNVNMFVELEATQHAFEIFHSVRTEFTIDAIQLFLEIIYQDYAQSIEHQSV